MCYLQGQKFQNLLMITKKKKIQNDYRDKGKSLYFSLGLIMVMFWSSVFLSNFVRDISSLAKNSSTVVISIITLTLLVFGESVDMTNSIWNLYLELKKIKWPTRQESIQSVLVVLLCLITISLIVYCLDSLFIKLMKSILG